MQATKNFPLSSAKKALSNLKILKDPQTFLGEDDGEGIIGFVGKLIGKVLVTIVETIADIFDSREDSSEEIRLAASELFDDNNVIGLANIFNFNELGELAALNQKESVPVEASPFKISGKAIRLI